MIRWEKLNDVNKKYFQMFYSNLKELEDTGLYTMGKNVEQFENEVKEYIGTKYAVACGNGLDGLTLAIKSLDIPKGSEVIVPSNTFYASVLAILRNGLVPVLCEPNINTYNIEIENIKKLVTPKTKAIMVVHLYGNVCDMDSINQFAKENNLYVIEDCAQSFGATYKGRMSGNLSDVGVFSFFPTKNLGGIGDAGMIVTNNEKIYEYTKLARSYGGANYNYEIEGINSRMDELHAIFLKEKLKDIEKINEVKIRNANLYLKNIKNENIIFSEDTPDSKNVYYIFPIRCKRRDELKKYLYDNGVEALIHYPIPLHKMPVFKDKYGVCEVAEEISATELSLPCSAAHTEEEILRVIELINDFK
ncbi:MAG: DegT/DnrJ/EryC1/StrS family aminotransferase [Clostridia bacterium]|nr:DegT/DnrJ/EryC1/StrS family aminotransferase [Clostridia bacterium]